MNYLRIKMNQKKKLIYTGGKLVLGNKLDHNIFSLQFEIPTEFYQENRYVIFFNKENNIKLSYKLDKNNCVNISSNITQHPIEYNILLVMFKSEELTEDNIVCISESIKGIVNNNDLEIGDIEDDTDPFVIILSSDMNTINSNIETIKDSVNSIKTDLIDEIIESNTETKTTVEKIKDKIDELSTSITENIQTKLETLKNKISEDNTVIIDKIQENNTELSENNTKIEENTEKIIENNTENKTELLQNENNNKDKIIEKIQELETSNNLTYDILDQVNDVIKNQIICREDGE